MADIRVNVPEELKAEAMALYKNMGMNLSDAVRIFLAQSVNSGGLPFTPHVNRPNTETIKAFKEAEDISELKKYDSIDDMFNDLDLDS